MMISVTVSAWRAGSIASFSSSSPTTTAASTASGTAAGSGSPAPTSVTAAHAADHHELALREVDRAAGVVDDREAERDERIDRPGGQPAGNELEPLAAHRVGPVRFASARFHFTIDHVPFLTSSSTKALRSSPM